MANNTNVSWGFPFKFDKSGRVARVGGKATSLPTNKELSQAVITCVKQIMFTSPGERVMNVNFGVDVDEFAFSPAGNHLTGLLEREMHTQINQWDARVEVTGTNVAIVQQTGEVVASFSLRYLDTDQDEVLNVHFN